MVNIIFCENRNFADANNENIKRVEKGDINKQNYTQNSGIWW